jgi:hypothetical protein
MSAMKLTLIWGKFHVAFSYCGAYPEHIFIKYWVFQNKRSEPVVPWLVATGMVKCVLIFTHGSPHNEPNLDGLWDVQEFIVTY